MWILETIELGGLPTVAIARNGGHIPLAAAGTKLGLPLNDSQLIPLLQEWEENWPLIQKIADQIGDKSDLAVYGAKQLPQFGATQKVICGGANYYKHLVEMDVKFTKEEGKPPFFFMKPPTALAGPGRTLPLDPGITMLDWEVELAAIIGKTGKDIPVDEALSHIAGYTIAIDVTARDRLFNPDSIFKFDFLTGKGQDGYCPTAFGMLPATFVKDVQNTRIRLSVNGVMKQDSSTDDMIYSVAELVSWASKTMTLTPGDVLLTGSPAGVGFPKREFLKVGDLVRAELDGLGGFDVEVFAKGSAS